MSELITALAAEIQGDPSCAKALKVLDLALAHGWTENPRASLVLRLDHPDGEPMYVAWELFSGSNGKRSWRFLSAAARNGQSMTLNDVMAVIENPVLVYPEPPENMEVVSNGTTSTAG